MIHELKSAAVTLGIDSITRILRYDWKNMVDKRKKKDAIGIKHKIHRAMPVLPSLVERCQHFSQKILPSVHKSGIFRNSEILSPI